MGTNGYFTFDGFNGFSPFIFDANTDVSLVAPFFADIDITGGGQIRYEIHTDSTSQSILSQVNSVINDHAQTVFSGEWLLVASWENVPPYGDYSLVRGQQHIIIASVSINFLYIGKYIPGNNCHRFLKIFCGFYLLLWRFKFFWWCYNWVCHYRWPVC